MTHLRQTLGLEPSPYRRPLRQSNQSTYQANLPSTRDVPDFLNSMVRMLAGYEPLYKCLKYGFPISDPTGDGGGESMVVYGNSEADSVSTNRKGETKRCSF